LGSSGRTDCVEGVGLALAVPVLSVGAVNLDYPDAGGSEVTGQASPVAAGPFDPYQAERAEGSQPSQSLA
jgi:hypothetical protein